MGSISPADGSQGSALDLTVLGLNSGTSMVQPDEPVVQLFIHTHANGHDTGCD